jgi:hypothetical protein
VNVHWWIGLPPRAKFERGKDMNVHGWAGVQDDKAGVGVEFVLSCDNRA